MYILHFKNIFENEKFSINSNQWESLAHHAVTPDWVCLPTVSMVTTGHATGVENSIKYMPG